MDREGALDADLEADLADREGLADALVLLADDDALEDLDALARALDDVHVHLDGVAGTEVGDVRAEVGGVNRVEDVHSRSLSAAATGRLPFVVGCPPSSDEEDVLWRGRLP